MNPLLPALHELARIYDRQVNRAALWMARRKLASAETHLGLLGWQQADFEGEAQGHVDQLNKVEMEQSRLTNESAAHGFAIRETQEKRDAGRREYEAARVAAEVDWKKASEPIETAERLLAARRNLDVDFDALVADLDRELEALEAQCTELLGADTITSAMRNELVRLRTRAAAISPAKDEVRNREAQAGSEIRMIEEKLAKARPLLAAATGHLHAIDAQFARSDGAFERAIAARVAKKEAVEKQIEELEKAKNNPYRQIGQILADSGIAPMNQPEALPAVQHRRAVVAGLVRLIFESHETSKQEDPERLRKSWIMLAILMGVFLIALLVLAN